MRTLIKNGIVYDGSGGKPYQKQILVEDDKIAAITEERKLDADEVIDAAGMAVTPGFIDTHRHCDIDALYNPDFGRLELAQGLTTVFGGNCGLAPIPAGRHRQEIVDFIEPCLGIAPPSMDMEHYAEYLEALARRRLPLHVGSFIGTGSLKAAIKGYGRGPFTEAEMEEAERYIKEGLAAGAAGLSMGIMYQPECYSDREELCRLASFAAPFGKPLACHIRGEGDSLTASVKEILDIAKRAEVPLTISHFKVTGIKNWGSTIGKAIEMIEAARDSGQDVMVDFYPYCGGSTTLISLLPPTVMEDSVELTLKRLITGEGREALKRELYREHEGWDNMVTAIGWKRIILSFVTKEENRRFAGKSIQEAAVMTGYDDPADFFCDLLIDEQGKVGIIVLSMSQEDVDTVAKLPYSMVISDSLYGNSDRPHPRLYGSFPKILREYVGERRVLTMEEAVRKMTALPAARLSLTGRGLIREGYYADINLFRPERVKDLAVYGDPKQLSSGFDLIMVDGKKAVSNDAMVRWDCGSVIKL